MKFLLTVPIQIYWDLIPESKRRRCIHRVSCSQYVYSATMKHGLVRGIKTLIHRMRTCRGGYEIISLKSENVMVLVLKNGEVLQEQEVSEQLVAQYRFPYTKHQQ